MDRKDYDDKIQQMLNDQRTYKVLEKYLIQRTERKLNEKLASLNERTRSVTAFTKDFAVLMDCLLVFVVYQRFISLVSPLDLLFRL